MKTATCVLALILGASMAEGRKLGDCVPTVTQICWICTNTNTVCGAPSCWNFVDGNNPFPAWTCNGCPPLAWQIKVDDCGGTVDISRVWIKTQYKKPGETRWQPLDGDGIQVETSYPYTSFGDVYKAGVGGSFPDRLVTGLDFKTGDYRISVEVNRNNATKKTMELSFNVTTSGGDPNNRDLQGCSDCEGPHAMEL